MKCSKCGNDNLPGAKFCTGCGATLTTAAPSATATSLGMGSAAGTSIQPGVAPLAVATAGAALGTRTVSPSSTMPPAASASSTTLGATQSRPVTPSASATGMSSITSRSTISPSPNATIAPTSRADATLSSPARPAAAAPLPDPAPARSQVGLLIGLIVLLLLICAGGWYLYRTLMGGFKEPSTGAVPAPPSSNVSQPAPAPAPVQDRTRTRTRNSARCRIGAA